MVTETQIPYAFDEFFASGKEETISPFLTPKSRLWGKHLPLKVALLSAAFLATSFTTSFFHPTLSSLSLLCVYFLSGTPALLGAMHDLKNLEINIDVLMTFAALLSVVIGSQIEGALLLVLFEFSGAMENMVAEKTKGTLAHLNQISPRFACVVGQDGTLYDRAVREIPVSTHLLIKAGEIVPLDGRVINGKSFVNLFHLTGESHPVPKEKGDEVAAGARNLDGTLTIEVLRTSGESTLSRIVKLITQAQEAKPRLQRFLDRFGKWYAMTIMGLAFLFALLLPWIFSLPYLGPEGGIYRALAFLIAASPCALIIATPTAYLSAISACARQGILLKGGVILDAITSCRSIAFDKTGTLTTGKLSCASIERVTNHENDCTEQEALAIAFALERNAVHPIADAICQTAIDKGLKPAELQGFKSIAGSGLEGTALLSDKPTLCAIGNREFIALKLAQPIDSEKWKKPGYLQTFLLVDQTLFLFHFIDTIRTDSKPVIQRLEQNEGLKTLMLTGDHPEIANAVAREVGIREIYANLRPEDKLAKVGELSQKEGLMMVGDGINDAPALARATVGISLGKIGSATAVDASDVVFLNDDLYLLDWLVRKSRQTVRIVKQNITLALCVIAFATTPALLGLVPLWVAVILHEGGTVLVGLNSLRLLRRKRT